MEKVKKSWFCRRWIKETPLQVLGLCVSLNFRYLSKCFAEIYRAQYENAMLVHICGAPIWRPENSVNIWNLFWLSRRVIICSEQTCIYLSTFPTALTSKKAQNHEKKLDRRLVSSTAIFKILWFPNETCYWALKLQTDVNLPPLMPNEDKNFRNSLVLDLRKWWRHVKTIYGTIMP